jgi:hypothetical protein
VFKDMQVWDSFERKFRSIRSGFQSLTASVRYHQLLLSTQTCTDLQQLTANSTDLVFTDPPYAEKTQYGELNFIWEAWLGLDTHWHDEEIIVNEVRGKTPADWAAMMRLAMAECYRVLKPGRWLSLCYHDTAEGTWALIQDIMAEVGFVVDRTDEALFIDTGQKSQNQLTADKVTKRDLVINFRKPKPGEIAGGVTLTGEEDERTFREKVLTVIRDHLQARPGATKDRIYDEVVSRLVRKGRMEAFDFGALLAEVAEPVTEAVKKDLFQNKDPDLFGGHQAKRWYLKESADTVDAAESAKEEACAGKLEAFMREHLKKHSHLQGVHYSDLFEHVLTMDRPRREMAEWLWDWFYKTDDGTWRPPETDEEKEEKRKQRATGVLRKIKGYAKLLDEGAPIPARLQPDSDRTIADWIRQARRAGLFLQGKTIFEKSGLSLSKLEKADGNLKMDVDEDYQYCLRQLGHGEA